MSHWNTGLSTVDIGTVDWLTITGRILATAVHNRNIRYLYIARCFWRISMETASGIDGPKYCILTNGFGCT